MGKVETGIPRNSTAYSLTKLTTEDSDYADSFFFANRMNLPELCPCILCVEKIEWEGKKDSFQGIVKSSHCNVSRDFV